MYYEYEKSPTDEFRNAISRLDKEKIEYLMTSNIDNWDILETFEYYIVSNTQRLEHNVLELCLYGEYFEISELSKENEVLIDAKKSYKLLNYIKSLKTIFTLCDNCVLCESCEKKCGINIKNYINILFESSAIEAERFIKECSKEYKNQTIQILQCETE